MKFTLFVFLLFTLVFSELLVAQENEKFDFSASIGLIFTHTDEPEFKDNPYWGSTEGGLNANLMFFRNSNFGYYFNIYFFPRSILNLDNVYFGIIPGIGYKIEINDYLSFLTGIGPELRYSLIKASEDSEGSEYGIGIGGTLEMRLQLYKRFSFAGGVLISSIFFDRMDRNFSVHPYIGFAWN